MLKKTKIIATLGPASNSIKGITQLAKAGVNVFRLNFSFGSYEEHQQVIDNIRQVEKKINRPLAILQDLQGPKIRVGKLTAPVTVKKGTKLTLSGKAGHKDPLYIPTTYRQIASDTKKGKTILLADGKIILSVLKTNKEKAEVFCKVENGGTILTGKGINLPYTKISLPALTPKDKKDALFGLKAGVDYMGLSFVRQTEDVLKLKKLMIKAKKEIPIISKIEKPEAVDNLGSILNVTDGVMVARGDLAVEISFARVPLLQKEIIKQANIKGKLTVVATEMLSSMVDNPLPTRAEASDVANAVLDGTDAVMLSNETAVGKFPVKSVEAMKNIIEETETLLTTEKRHELLDLPEIHDKTQAICDTAAHLSYHLFERALGVITHTGTSVKIISKYRPQSPIYAAAFSLDVYRKMAFYHNVYPVLLDEETLKKSTVFHSSLENFEKKLKQSRLLQKGNSIIFLTGDISASGWHLNTIKVKDF